MRFSNARIDAFIEEDVPYIDLTCEVLGVHNQPGEMEYFTRESCVLAGTDIARRIMRNLGCEVLASSEDGQLVSAGQTFFTVRGQRRICMPLGKCALTCSIICRPLLRKHAVWSMRFMR